MPHHFRENASQSERTFLASRFFFAATVLYCLLPHLQPQEVEQMSLNLKSQQNNRDGRERREELGEKREKMSRRVLPTFNFADLSC
mmetsp:Transcript_51030/g.100312  ORF Transcript_51030/g.100312 Transcript_51030/m.100312 type:complete len:86 (+) Transcript_51030:142-399(+)